MSWTLAWYHRKVNESYSINNKCSGDLVEIPINNQWKEHTREILFCELLPLILSKQTARLSSEEERVEPLKIRIKLSTFFLFCSIAHSPLSSSAQQTKQEKTSN